MKLYLKQKVFAIGDKYKFKNAAGEVVFEGKKGALSLTKMELTDDKGEELCRIKRKLIALFPEYKIYKEEQEVIKIKKKFSLIRPKFVLTDAEGFEYKMDGNWYEMSFQLEFKDAFVGSIRKKFIAIGDSYELNISDDFPADVFCCIALVIDNCLHNGNNNKRGD